MKAPLAWPKSSLCKSCSGSAAQSTITNGAARRAEASWIASATRSFPVPVSPKISAVESVAATAESVAKSSRITTLWPTRAPKRASGQSGTCDAAAEATREITVDPTWIFAVSGARAEATRMPLMKVPLRLPRSRIHSPSRRGSISAWRRETVESATARSAPFADPTSVSRSIDAVCSPVASVHTSRG